MPGVLLANDSTSHPQGKGGHYIWYVSNAMCSKVLDTM
jgi:hypothetical protein